MNLYENLVGNSHELSPDYLTAKYENLLIDTEYIELGFKVSRDTFIFTTKRLIVIEKSLFSRNTYYESISYSKIIRLAIKTTPVFSLYNELIVWFSNRQNAFFRKKITKNIDIYAIKRYLITKIEQL